MSLIFMTFLNVNDITVYLQLDAKKNGHLILERQQEISDIISEIMKLLH